MLYDDKKIYIFFYFLSFFDILLFKQNTEVHKPILFY